MSLGLHSLLSGTLHPLAHGSLAHAQGVGYLRCFQPRSFSSKARKRLPSRQSVA